MGALHSDPLVRSQGSAGHDNGNERLQLSSEFAAVAVEVDNRANGPRLRIENRQNQRVIYLDPLEVASLTWLTHDRLGPFLDPSQTGWGNDDEGV